MIRYRNQILLRVMKKKLFNNNKLTRVSNLSHILKIVWYKTFKV